MITRRVRIIASAGNKPDEYHLFFFFNELYCQKPVHDSFLHKFYIIIMIRQCVMKVICDEFYNAMIGVLVKTGCNIDCF